nr:unnamed protein product [Callosobruchus analis]
MLNCILCEKNHHFKSIDIHYTSSPLFTTCILFVTVSLLQTQLVKPYVCINTTYMLNFIILSKTVSF